MCRWMKIDGHAGLCMTKLDVLDGLDEVKLCVGYKLGGKDVDILPRGASEVARCEPVYETFRGWKESTIGITQWSELPAKAQAYLTRVQEVAGVPIDMGSTGPDRDATILLLHPFNSLSITQGM